MQPENANLSVRGARQAPRATTAFVQCAVQVSPTLARFFRKCAAAESRGASAHEALLSPLGFRIEEVTQLKAENRRLNAELQEAHESADKLRQAVDAANSIVTQRDHEQNELRRLLKEAVEEGRARTPESEKPFAGLVSDQKGARHCFVSTDGLDELAARAVEQFTGRLQQGDNIKAACLASAGYDLRRGEVAMATQDRDEVRALDALLSRPAWRRRVVMWLLAQERPLTWLACLACLVEIEQQGMSGIP